MSPIPTFFTRKKNIGLSLLLLFAGIAFSVLVYFIIHFFAIEPQGTPGETGHTFKITRLGGLKNIHPVVSVQEIEESAEFNPIKQKMLSTIQDLKMDGSINEATVYLKEFDHGGWMAVNNEVEYHPASLMKVALLICYLRMAESAPGLLEKELLFEKPKEGEITKQYYTDLSIEPGKKYKIHELLVYMIAYSDNNATWLLSQHFDSRLLYKLFADLGLKQPVKDEMAFKMSAKEYSTFMNAIYNAAYLTPEYSDYAAELLRNCTFSKGFGKGIGIDRDSMMWHKFGEWRQPGADYELHESGFIHVKGQSFLLTVMTRGKDTDKLAAAISKISGQVFELLDLP